MITEEGTGSWGEGRDSYVIRCLHLILKGSRTLLKRRNMVEQLAF